MIKQYVRLRLKHGVFWLIAALVWFVSVLVFPNFFLLEVNEQMFLRQTVHFTYFSEIPLLTLWFPLFSLLLLFQHQFFSPYFVYSRYHMFRSFWGTRLAVLFLDAVFFLTVLHIGYLLYGNSIRPYSYGLSELLFELRCLIPQLASLFLYACFCTVLSALLRKAFAGIMLSYLLLFLDYVVGTWFLAGQAHLFIRGFYVHENWAAVGKTIALSLVILGGLLVVLWCCAGNRDQLIEEKD